MSEYVMDYSGWAEGIPAVEYLKVCDAMHARKREEIVRCRDCKHFASDELGDCCTLLDFEDVKPMDNGFCAWGERRDA